MNILEELNGAKTEADVIFLMDMVPGREVCDVVKLAIDTADLPPFVRQSVVRYVGYPVFKGIYGSRAPEILQELNHTTN